jgi:phosphoglycolate phosphatase
MSPSNGATHTPVWIFDFDGTLVDSMGDLQRHAETTMMRFFDVPREQAAQSYRRTSGRPFAKQMEILFPRHPAQSEAIEAFEAIKDNYATWAVPFPEVSETIATLRRRGDFVAISSNNFRHHVEACLTAHAIAVDTVCGWNGTVGKGANHLAEIATASASPATTSCFVGDSLHDAELAHRFDLDFIGRTGTFSAAEFTAAFPSCTVIASLRELL